MEWASFCNFSNGKRNCIKILNDAQEQHKLYPTKFWPDHNIDEAINGPYCN